jgi:hypothetical protein
VAYIVSENGRAVVNKSAASPLARADIDRVLDCYRLALMGNGQSRRMWNDFAAESPDTARLIVKLDQAEKGGRAEANALLDGVLIKAETTGMYGKSGKKARGEMKAKRAAQQPQTWQPQPPKTTVRDMLKANLADPDPRVRLTAAALLGKKT